MHKNSLKWVFVNRLILAKLLQNHCISQSVINSCNQLTCWPGLIFRSNFLLIYKAIRKQNIVKASAMADRTIILFIPLVSHNGRFIRVRCFIRNSRVHISRITCYHLNSFTSKVVVHQACTSFFVGQCLIYPMHVAAIQEHKLYLLRGLYPHRYVGCLIL